MPGSTTRLPETPDCPFFEYENHERKHEILSVRQEELLQELLGGRINVPQALADTRPYHYRLFSELAPEGFEYYAGHYRGENWPCLKNCRVSVESDPRVGCPPALVINEMRQFAEGFREALAAVDEIHSSNNRLTPVEKAGYAIALACNFFVHFLGIHPYMNGNGHIARFCLIAILARYGLKLRRWGIEPRPSGPYGNLISLYRDGKREYFERFVFSNCDRIPTLPIDPAPSTASEQSPPSSPESSESRSVSKL